MAALHRRLLRRLHPAGESDAGFTLIEVIAAASIGLVLAVSVTGVVAGTLDVVAVTSATATEGVVAQRVLSDFTAAARDQSTILTASTTQLTFTYRAVAQCELHSYQLGDDPDNRGRLRLHHTVLAVNIDDGVQCPAVNEVLVGGSLAPKADRDEINDLGPTSAFSYSDTTGMPVAVWGNAGYVAAEQALPCLLGSVQLQLDTRIIARGSITTASESGFAAFRNNTRGLGCN